MHVLVLNICQPQINLNNLFTILFSKLHVIFYQTYCRIKLVTPYMIPI